VNLPVTNAARCVSPNANTFGLQHLPLPDMAASGGQPNGACIVHHRTAELLTKQHTACDGQATSPINELARHALSLSYLSSNLVDVGRPGQPCIRGHPRIPCCFDPFYWLSEILD
jgi:hypothetical protein